MSDAQGFDDRRPDEDPYRDDPVAPRKGMSKGAKIAITLGVCAGVVGLICCGGIGWFVLQVRNGLTEDPVKVVALQKDMLSHIAIPEDMAPTGGMDLQLFGVKVAVFGADPDAKSGGMLMLMQMPNGADPDQMRREMEKARGSQKEFDLEKSETKPVVIDGETVDVKIAQGKERKSGEAIREVLALIEGRNGPIMVILNIPEEKWDEEKVLGILQSIKK